MIKHKRCVYKVFPSPVLNHQRSEVHRGSNKITPVRSRSLVGLLLPMVFIQIQGPGRIVASRFEPAAVGVVPRKTAEPKVPTEIVSAASSLKNVCRSDLPRLHSVDTARTSNTPDQDIREASHAIVHPSPRAAAQGAETDQDIREASHVIVHPYYLCIRPTFASRVTLFTENIPWFSTSQRTSFNVHPFAEQIYNAVCRYDGLSPGSVAASDFCLAYEDRLKDKIGNIMIGDSRLMDKIENVMLGDDIMVGDFDFDHISSYIKTIDFDQIEVESGSVGMLKLEDLQFGVPIFPSAKFGDDTTKRSLGPSIFDFYNLDMFDISAPLLSSSPALRRSICNSTHGVERLLAITAATKTAQQLMLSSIIVVDDIAKMHVLASILRASMDSYNVPVCEFFVGIIWSGDSQASVDKTSIERARQMQELRNTLTDRGIVITLRRTPVLNALIGALVQYKSQKTQSPGNTFTYQEDVHKFNTAVALFKTAQTTIEYKRLEVMKNACIDGHVFDFTKTGVVKHLSVNSSKVVKHLVKHLPVDSSLARLKKKRKSESVRLSRKKSASHHQVKNGTYTAQTTSCAVPKKGLYVDAFVGTTTTNPMSITGNYFDEAGKTESIATYKTRLTKEELYLKNEDIRREEVALVAHGQDLAREHQRLMDVTLPTSLGYILILDDRDDDNDQDQSTEQTHGLKKHIEVLSGRFDRYQRMVKPHCTVILTQAASPEMH